MLGSTECANQAIVLIMFMDNFDKIQYIYQQLVEIKWIDFLTEMEILKCCAETCKDELF